MASIIRVFITLLLIHIAIAQTEVEKCGPNEVYNDCGSACVETCTFTPEICIMLCVSGCFCQEGYVRQSSEAGSPCVQREECQAIEEPKCGPNEEYRTCGNRCAEKTCYDITYQLPKPLRSCAPICLQGCFCKHGFYRNADGKCVKPEKCCGKHETYEDCGTACPQTCYSSDDKCDEWCVAGCFCRKSKHDYVRKDYSEGSPCIRRSNCPNATEPIIKY